MVWHFWASGPSGRFHVVVTLFRTSLRIRSGSHVQKKNGENISLYKKKSDFQKDFETIFGRGRNFWSKNQFFLDTFPPLVSRFAKRYFKRGLKSQNLLKIPLKIPLPKQADYWGGSEFFVGAFLAQNFDLNFDLDRARNFDQKMCQKKFTFRPIISLFRKRYFEGFLGVFLHQQGGLRAFLFNPMPDPLDQIP